MRATIGNMEANIAADGRSIELVPPGGERPAIHLNAFEAGAAPDAHAAGPAASTIAAHPPVGRTDLMTGAGAALVVSALAVGFVLRRGFAGSERTGGGSARPHEARPDDDAERIAFMKRYGGAR